MPRIFLLALVFALAVGAFWWITNDGGPRDGTAGEGDFPERLPVDEPATDDPWGDANWLVPHYERACEAVEAICGAPFELRPTLRIGTGVELSDLYRLTAVEYARRAGEPMPPDLPGNEALFAQYAKYQWGRYFREEHAVTISREAFDRYREDMRPSLHGGDGVTLILVHELTHAWQNERHPELWLHAMFQADKEAADCAWAAVEGHAQHVTRLVAERWGIRGAFRDFRAYYERLDRGNPRGERLEDKENWRLYVAGQDFMDALYRSGGTARVLEALADPPRRWAEIYEPQRWLANRRE